MDVSLEELLEAGCHFGHRTTRWHPKMKPYIFTARDGIHIFDLAQTREGLLKAASFISQTIKKGGKVLFVGTKRQAKEQIVKTAKKLGQPYVDNRWLGGTITNWDQMKKRIDKLHKMRKEREEGEYKKFTKKERLLLDREISRLESLFGGISELEKVPDAIFLVDTKNEKTAVREAARKEIPMVAICDTNSDPTNIEYVIPANDDAQKSIELILKKIEEAVLEEEEKKRRAEKKTKTKRKNQDQKDNL